MFRLRLPPLLVLLVLLAAGCPSGNFTEYPIDPQDARTLMMLVLKSWKEGKPPDFLRMRKPEIVVQDFDWSTGRRLVSYEIVGRERIVHAQLEVQAELVLEQAGTRTNVTARYLIGNDPVITVFRQ